jgi:ATP-dependent Clp protease protease subunit
MLFFLFYLFTLVFNKQIFVELNEKNTIILKGPINSNTINNLIHYKGNIESDDIYIYITSPGGSVHSGNVFIEYMNALKMKNKNVICIADVALSMAFVIFQHCPIRYILSSSVLMQHQMSLGLIGSIDHINNRFTMIKSMERQLNQKQALILKLNEDEFKMKISNDWWLYGKDILDNNAADEIIVVFCDKNMLGENNTENIVINTLFGDYELVYSKCPLVRDPLKIKSINNYNINDYYKILDIYTINKYLDNYSKNRKVLNKLLVGLTHKEKI